MKHTDPDQLPHFTDGNPTPEESHTVMPSRSPQCDLTVGQFLLGFQLAGGRRETTSNAEVPGWLELLLR